MDSKRLQEYLRRIKFNGNPAPSLKTLQQLHQHHEANIPFENLNPFLGLPVRLDMESLVQKLIFSRRGGYCYENNLLFREILTTLGFRVRSLEARVLLNTSPGHISPRTHMLLLIAIENNLFTADVGFGGLTPSCPLILKPTIEQETASGKYRLLQAEDHYILQTFLKDQWKPIYSFDLQEQTLPDYEMANWYTSRNPASHFTKRLSVSRKLQDCRYSLRNNKFGIYPKDGPIEKHILSSPNQIIKTLRGPFGLNLSGLPQLSEKLEKIMDKNADQP